jgi:hypothetical protein
MSKQEILEKLLQVSSDTLTHKLLEDSYTIIPQAFDKKIIGQLLAKLSEIIAIRKEKLEDYTRGYGYYYDLQNEDIIFIKTIFNQPILRDILITLLNDPYYKNIPQDKPNYIFRGIRTRDAVKKGLPLHIDSFVPSCSNTLSGLFHQRYLKIQTNQTAVL